MAAASYDVSAVVAHGAAAHEQQLKGRYVRCAEKWGRAVEAARALGAPDCLVLADAQLSHADLLFGQVNFSDGAHVEEDARFKHAMDLVHTAASVVERRRIAGTLLYGKCAPHEVELSHQMQSSRQFMSTGTCDAEVALFCAPFVGYEAYLTAARLMLRGYISLYRERPPTEPIMPPNISVVASALDLVCKPRPHEDITSPCEALFVEDVRCCHMHLSWLSSSDRASLFAACGRLKASGVIARRELDWMFQHTVCKVNEIAAKAQADADARGLRSCAHCGAREMHVTQFKRCAACKDKGALYCSKECQHAAWPAHKTACKAARKAAAAGAAGDA